MHSVGENKGITVNWLKARRFISPIHQIVELPYGRDGASYVTGLLQFRSLSEKDASRMRCVFCTERDDAKVEVNLQ